MLKIDNPLSGAIQKGPFFSAPCSAGDYMTESGCQQCGENTYSGDGATECTSCPDGMISSAGSTTKSDCKGGKQFIEMCTITDQHCIEVPEQIIYSS